MEFLVISLVAFAAAGLTLFSGFGLGTLLMPVFALFFPIAEAIAMTAVVHLLNNLFKLFLLGKHADREVVLKFGGPALLAAFLGAWTLQKLDVIPSIFNYTLGSHDHAVTPIKLTIAVLLIIFVILESHPVFQKISFEKRFLTAGGILSGFFGGLSGHQGALRSMFLIKSGLTKEAFIATGVVIACLVDFSRLFSYSRHFFTPEVHAQFPLLVTATLAAFFGVWLGSKYLHKMTLQMVQKIVAGMLVLIAFGLGSGLI